MSSFPEEVEIGIIGKDCYFNVKRGKTKPCCAIGNALAVLNNDMSPEDMDRYEGLYDDDDVKKFRLAYKKCAELFLRKRYEPFGVDDLSVEEINDDATAKERQILYAAAWGILGYRIYNFPEASKLVSQVKRIDRKGTRK